MATIASLLVKIGANIDDYNKKMNSVVSVMEKTASKLKSAGTALSIGVTAPIVAIGTASLKMAMDAIESENLFEVSMGNMAGSARKWSEDIRKQLGLNSYEVRKNVGTFNTEPAKITGITPGVFILNGI